MKSDNKQSSLRSPLAGARGGYFHSRASKTIPLLCILACLPVMLTGMQILANDVIPPSTSLPINAKDSLKQPSKQPSAKTTSKPQEKPNLHPLGKQWPTPKEEGPPPLKSPLLPIPSSPLLINPLQTEIIVPPPDLPPGVSIDLNRWKLLFQTSSKLLFLDTKTIQQCETVDATDCRHAAKPLGTAQGYSFWSKTILLSLHHSPVYTPPAKYYLNCNAHELNGYEVIPESPEESFYTYFCHKE